LERDGAGNLVFENTNTVPGKNIIHAYNDTTSSMMITTGSYTGTIVNGDTVIYRTTGSNIRIKDSPSSSVTWNYSLSGVVPDGQVSFYQVFMHEIGHILLMDHVIYSSELMHYSLSSTVSRPVINLTDNSIPVLAANQNIAKSRTINWSPNSGLKKIKVPKKPVITSFPVPVPCGNTLMLTSSYPSNNLWSTGATPQSIQVSTTSNYFVKHFEDNCEYMSDTVFVVAESLNAQFNVTDVSCYGRNTGAIIPSVSGVCPPFAYQWSGNGINSTSPTLSNLHAGEYYLLLSDTCGCSQNYAITINEPEELSAYLTFNSNTIEVHVSGGTPLGFNNSGGPFYTYVWIWIDNIGSLSTLPYTTPSIPATYGSNSNYTLFSMVIDDCGDLVFNSCAKSGRKKSTSYMISAFPNPTNNVMKITSNNASIRFIQLFDLQGKNVLSEEINALSGTLNLSPLRSGIYTAIIYLDNNDIEVKKFVKH
jgi:hypothetical protein